MERTNEETKGVTRDEDKVILTINGKTVETKKGTTIFEAAREAGVPIPHLCYHPRLSKIGFCRLCLVEVEGKKNLPASCRTPVEKGMIVWTESERVVKARREILNQLMENYPEYYLNCEETGDYRLREYARIYQARTYKMEKDTCELEERVHDTGKVRTICPYCGVGCALNLHVNKGVVVGISPASGPANRNLLCVKGRFGWDFVQNPDRLTTPLIKFEGRFVEAGWDEALSLVAEKFNEIKKKYGANALAGLSSAKCTNEENYLMQKFMRAVIGTNNVDNSARLCHSPTVTGLAEAFGSGAATNSIAEIEEADVIFIIGSNTTEAHPVIGIQIQKAHRRGTKIIVVDPRNIDLTESAEIHLQLLPGTDVALLNGIMHVIIKKELHDKNFIRNRTEGFDDLSLVLEKYTPEYVEGITGVPAEKIVKAAEMYGTAKRATLLYAMGITQHVHGTENVRSAANLVMLTGNVGRPSTGIYPLRGQNNVQGACDMGAYPNYYPGYQQVLNESIRRKFEEAWKARLSPQIGLTVVEMFEGALDGSIKGMYIMGENPALSNPDINRVEKGLAELDFLVVQDIFLTETAVFADVVLPGCSFAEKDGTFTNTERRVQRIRKAIDPVGYSLPDWEILMRLSEKMGYPAWYSSPAEIMGEIAQVTPLYSGIAYDRLVDDQGIQWPCPDRTHPGTKFLHHKRFAGGLGKFAAIEYDPPSEQVDDEYPFLLITGRNIYQYHTGTMTRRSVGLQGLRPDPYVEIHPYTAQKIGIKQGEVVKLTSRRGDINAKAFLTDRVLPGQVYIPFHYAEGAANVLTHISLDRKAKIPELKISAVKISRLKNRNEKIPALSICRPVRTSALLGELTKKYGKIEEIVRSHKKQESSLILILSEIQKKFGYISPENMFYVAKRLNRPLSEVYGIVSYYAQFYLKPRGENIIRVCQGTVCHAHGGGEILASFSHELGIKPGETTTDQKFSLERVACVGACGLAPVVVVNEEILGEMAPNRVPEVLEMIVRKRPLIPAKGDKEPVEPVTPYEVPEELIAWEYKRKPGEIAGEIKRDNEKNV